MSEIQTKEVKLAVIGKLSDLSEQKSSSSETEIAVAVKETPDKTEAQDKSTKSTRLPIIGGMSSFTKLLAGFTVASGTLLHFFGHVAHELYLSTWGIDPGLFPKSLYWTAVNGYYTVFDRIMATFTALTEDGRKFGVLAACVSAIVVYIYALSLFDGKKKDKRPAKWVERLPKWLRGLLASLGIAAITVSLIPALLAWAAIVMAIPGLLGESRGKSAALEDYKMFLRGCEKAPVTHRCFELQKDGVKTAKGFLIDSSETHVAMFDVDLKKARVLERNGLELVAEPPALP